MVRGTELSRAAFDTLVGVEANHVLCTVQQRGTEHRGTTDALGGWRKRGLLGVLIRLEEKLERLDVAVSTGAADPVYMREVFTDIAGYALCGLVWTRAVAFEQAHDTALDVILDDALEALYGKQFIPVEIIATSEDEQ